MKILLVEDDLMLGQGTQTAMQQYGYTVDWVKDGKAALAIADPTQYHAIVLDLGLPKIFGLKVLQQWRQQNLLVPVLILTARDSIDDRVTGLDMGADDYLIKPFDLDELCARIRALQRRSSGKEKSKNNSIVNYANISLDLHAYTVSIDDQMVSLPRREFSLLEKLLKNVGKVLSRDQLTQSLYGWDEAIDSNALEVHIHNLRKKLNAKFIRTIRGVGYMIDKEK